MQWSHMCYRPVQSRGEMSGAFYGNFTGSLYGVRARGCVGSYNQCDPRSWLLDPGADLNTPRYLC